MISLGRRKVYFAVCVRSILPTTSFERQRACLHCQDIVSLFRVCAYVYLLTWFHLWT